MDYVGPISSAVMAIVWMVYFQVFFIQYKRNSSPYLVIHHAQNENPDALCLMVNMGKETVHIQCVQVVVYARSGEKQVLTVTEYRRVGADDQRIEQILRQGPLQPGAYLVLGSFRSIILGRRSEEEDAEYLLEDITDIELRAAAIHGPSRSPVGVRRHFVLEHGGGGTRIYPRSIHSEQLTGRKERREVRQWVEEELRPEREGRSESDNSDQTQ